RIARLFTPTYAARINAQLVHPAQSIIVKPNELESALARPLHVARYEPDSTPSYLAAQIAYGIIKGHPFIDGNKQTANEYLRAHGLPGFVDTGDFQSNDLHTLAERYISVAKGDMDANGLAS
ncbi:uncharacterized protein FOMMEDRAFT_96972, partial [Fomitiporia mediterranea MF3/22]|uniref:uncharacterized protein n=1 Tax=Fomitiporia mediterranea (strain MF3/22) TaxID=694068 RepID=UPI00044094ED